ARRRLRGSRVDGAHGLGLCRQCDGSRGGRSPARVHAAVRYRDVARALRARGSTDAAKPTFRLVGTPALRGCGDCRGPWSRTAPSGMERSEGYRLIRHTFTTMESLGDAIRATTSCETADP